VKPNQYPNPIDEYTSILKKIESVKRGFTLKNEHKPGHHLHIEIYSDIPLRVKIERIEAIEYNSMIPEREKIFR